jgi:hypothetical protein
MGWKGLKPMNNVKWLCVGAAFWNLLVACAPQVTVAEDDAGGAAGEPALGEAGAGPVIGIGGSSGGPTQGTAGNGPQGSAGAVATTCPCSRRAEAPISMQCPRGSDRAIAMNVGPDGGSIALSGTRQTQAQGVPVKLDIFAGSLENETKITLLESSLSPPDGFVDWSPVYVIEPTGLDFVQGSGITIPWRNSLQEIDDSLAIYFAETADGPFEKLADSYVNAGFSQATALKAGYFFVGYPAASDSGCP